MKTLINQLTSEEAARAAGKIVNYTLAAAGAIYCIVGIVWQVSKNL